MKLHSEKGTAVVEFALVLPLLLVVVFGIIEFSFILYNQAMITNASREGARSAIIVETPRKSTGEITTVVNNYLNNYLVTFSTGAPPAPATVVKINNVEADPSTAGLVSAQDYVTVEVRYTYDFLIIPDFITSIAGTKTLFASSTMRAE
jgi:Flp pilus assembly protein TadG